MQTSEEKIKILEEKRKKLEAKIQREKSKLTQQARKADTRRKILIGAALLAAVENGKVSDEELSVLLQEFVKTPRDRSFLGLDSGGHGQLNQSPITALS